jgi:hypothetical protein
VDLYNESLVVGVYQAPSSSTQVGEAYIFNRQPDTTWLKIAQLAGTSINNFSWHGLESSIYGNDVVVGAPANSQNATNAGLVSTYDLGALGPGDPEPVCWTCTETAVTTDKLVGVGTTSPDAKLHLYSVDPANDPADLHIENDTTTSADREMVVMTNHGGALINLTNSDSSETWTLATRSADNAFTFDFDGTTGVEFEIDESGDVHVANNLTAGGTITSSSDRNIKENFVPINHSEILGKLVDMEITEWNYIADGETTRHIGPMAQDFYAAFGVGLNDKTLSMVDINGVAFASIQALNEKLEAKDAEIQTLTEQNKALAQKLNKIEAMLERLVD